MQALKDHFCFNKLLTAVSEPNLLSQIVGFMFLHHNSTVNIKSIMWFIQQCGVFGIKILIPQSGSAC